MKTNILSLLALAGLLTFAGCASDDTANKDNNDQEPGTEGLTSFVEEDQATRTTGEYDGSGLNFYWTAGDRLWVNTGTTTSPVLTQDSQNNINAKLENNPTNPTAVKRVAKAKFWFSGTYTASSYPVRYTGKNGTADKVTIKAAQSQTVPNDASHIGEDGDFGVATATKPTGSEAYTFTLDHKAAYITFMPYTTQSEVAGAKIQKIRVYTSNPSDALAGTFDLADDGTLSNPASTSNSIELTVTDGTLNGGFSIPSTSTYATNAATMVVNPGTYSNVSIEYTLYDRTTNQEGTITKTYSSVTFTAGKNKKVHTDLQVTVYGQDSFYMWDAQQPYWYGHLDSDGIPDGNGPQNNTDPRWHREDTSWPCPAANHSAKDCPNINECIWYIMQGDPHWNYELWATMGHLYSGGIWFKKKAYISGFTDANYNGTDYRSTGAYFDNYSITQGLPNNRSDYFFLPGHLGYHSGTLYVIGSNTYWSSTPLSWSKDDVYALGFGYNYAGVTILKRDFGCRLWTAQ